MDLSSNPRSFAAEVCARAEPYSRVKKRGFDEKDPIDEFSETRNRKDKRPFSSAPGTGCHASRSDWNGAVFGVVGQADPGRGGAEGRARGTQRDRTGGRQGPDRRRPERGRIDPRL